MGYQPIENYGIVGNARLAEEAGVSLLAKDRDMRLILDSGLCKARSVPL